MQIFSFTSNDLDCENKKSRKRRSAFRLYFFPCVSSIVLKPYHNIEYNSLAGLKFL
uniref:Uncharacterized protein n=1 Tax=Lotus japonicus TaxID=34305 RepID=I3SE69_LOTJA|nr:unknown [Lotus japonicus]